MLCCEQSKLEYGRAVLAADRPKRSLLKKARRILKIADCVGGDPGNLGEVRSIREVLEVRLQQSKHKGKSGGSGSGGDGSGSGGQSVADSIADERGKPLNKLIAFIGKHVDEFDRRLDMRISGLSKADRLDDPDLDGTYIQALLRKVTRMSELHDEYQANKQNPVRHTHHTTHPIRSKNILKS